MNKMEQNRNRLIFIVVARGGERVEIWAKLVKVIKRYKIPGTVYINKSWGCNIQHKEIQSEIL